MADYLRLTDYALQSNEPRVMRTVVSLYDAGSIMARDIPFAVKKSIYANGSRFDGALPQPTWLDINDRTIPSNTSVPTPFQERAYLIREHVKTDVAYLQDENQFQDPHAFNIDMFLRGMAADFNDKFINNNHTTGNSKALVGLRQRLDDSATYGTRSANKIDAGGSTADMTAASATAKTYGAFCEKLDELLWSLNSTSGDGVTLYMPHQLIRRFNALGRQFSGQGGFSQAKDQLGRTVTMYMGAVIRDPGLKYDQSSNIITVTETSAGVNGASTFTSVYGVNYGAVTETPSGVKVAEGGVKGWTHLPLDVRRCEDSNGTHKIDLIEWMGGIMAADSKAIGRLYNVKIS